MDKMPRVQMILSAARTAGRERRSHYCDLNVALALRSLLGVGGRGAGDMLNLVVKRK